MENEKRITGNNADEFSFEKVGFYITNGNLVPVDRGTQARFSAIIQQGIAADKNKVAPK
jgi:predicted phage tail protein